MGKRKKPARKTRDRARRKKKTRETSISRLSYDKQRLALLEEAGISGEAMDRLKANILLREQVLTGSEMTVTAGAKKLKGRTLDVTVGEDTGGGGFLIEKDPNEMRGRELDLVVGEDTGGGGLLMSEEDAHRERTKEKAKRRKKK